MRSLPEASATVIGAAAAEAATCPVSGEELGVMGKPYEYTYKVEGQPDPKILLCCKHCVAKFEKAPARYLPKIDASAKAEGHMGM